MYSVIMRVMMTPDSTRRSVLNGHVNKHMVNTIEELYGIEGRDKIFPLYLDLFIV